MYQFISISTSSILTSNWQHLRFNFFFHFHFIVEPFIGGNVPCLYWLCGWVWSELSYSKLWQSQRVRTVRQKGEMLGPGARKSYPSRFWRMSACKRKVGCSLLQHTLPLVPSAFVMTWPPWSISTTTVQ